MMRPVLFELGKIRTIGLPRVLFGVSTGITLLFAILKAASSKGSASLSTASGLASVIRVPIWPLILVTVLGVTVATSEFVYNTATATYLAIPDRRKVLIAKLLASSITGVVFGLAASIASTVVGLSFVAAKHAHVALGGGEIARYLGGDTLACALLAALGCAVGSLLRSQIGALVAVFGWALVIEGLLSALYSSVTPYLPFEAARYLAEGSIPGGVDLPFGASAGLVAGTVVLIALVTSRETLPRDIA